MIKAEELSKAIFLTQKGFYDEAEKLYLQFLNHESENFFVLSAYGFSEFQRGDFLKSSKILKTAVQYGDNEELYFHLVKSLMKSGNLLESEKYCVEYLKQHQDSALLWLQLGFLKELIYSDDKNALECFRQAYRLGNLEALYNIAVSYQKQGDFDTAVEYYKKYLERSPEDIDTITSLGMCYLAQKKFKEGYDLFFRRDKSELNKRTKNPYKPDDNLEDEVVVLCDQGFGDHIQFIRYLPFLKERVKKVVVASHPALRSLFEKNYPEIEFISYDEINPEVQSIRVTDLAYVLGIDFDNIPFSEGYLNSDSAGIESDKLKVGFVWEAGNAGIRTMLNRTINIKLFEEMLNLANIQIYSFQKKDSLGGNEKYSQMINLAKDFNNFEDTARALKSMDVVVSVDTAVAHLSGALGVKTFLMLPYAADWRWFSDTKTTPWYKSVEIFKQSDGISWEKEIKDIISALLALKTGL